MQEPVESTEPSAPPPNDLSDLRAKAKGLGTSHEASAAPPASDDPLHPEPVLDANGGPKIVRKPLILPCKHTFCEPCITAWVEQQKKTSCPVCRAPIDEDEEPAPPPPPRPPCTPAGYTAQDTAQDTFPSGEAAGSGTTINRGRGGSVFRDRRQRFNHQDLLRDELLFRMLTLRR